jgi:ubiquitin-like 1-activating enzyme E1 B
MVPPSSTDSYKGGEGDDLTVLPPIVYQAHHGNVCDTTNFNVPFVQQFDLVLNALDNVEARRRVNRLCLAANVPLIEAGTTGYLGQVTVFHKGSNVACYECKTQETQKVYPICTIRSTPSMPVHTIVWGKELYKLFFHSKVEESMLFEDPNGEEPSTYMAAVSTVRDLLLSKTPLLLPSKEKFLAAIHQVLKEMYCTEIQKQLDMGRYKAAKKTPTSLEEIVLELGITSSPSPPISTTDIWSLDECVSVLVGCFQDAAIARADTDQVVLEEFDKDDDLAMRFVTAASNLRSSIFGIEPLQSLYSAKGIAGNIIPAIATTNAICAGLQILQAFTILKEQVELKKKKADATPGDLQLSDVCHYINCIRNPTRNGLYLTASPLESPNPNCFVCRNAIIPLTLNVNEWSLKEFLTRIVKGRLGFEEPTIMLQGDLIWEEGDGADVDEFKSNLPKLLPTLPCGGIHHGTVLEIDDNSQDLCIQVAVTHQDKWGNGNDDDEDIPDFPFVIGNLPQTHTTNKTTTTKTDGTSQVIDGDDGDKKPAAKTKTTSPEESVVVDDDNDVVLIIDEEDVVIDGSNNNKDVVSAAKRDIDNILVDGGGEERHAKKARIEKEEIEIIDVDED